MSFGSIIILLNKFSKLLKQTGNCTPAQLNLRAMEQALLETQQKAQASICE
jgi:hypothetical protein